MSISDRRFLLGISLVGGLIVVACGGNSGPTGPDSAVVAYSVTNLGSVIIDDLSYDDGHGTLVLVSSPGSNYLNSFNFAIPGSVEGVLHAHGAGETTFRAVWTVDGVTHADSSVVESGNGAFTIEISHHAI